MTENKEYPKWVYHPGVVWEDVFPENQETVFPDPAKALVVNSPLEVPKGWTERLKQVSDMVLAEVASPAEPSVIPAQPVEPSVIPARPKQGKRSSKDAG